MGYTALEKKVIAGLSDCIDSEIFSIERELDETETYHYSWCYSYPKEKLNIDKIVSKYKKLTGEYVSEKLPYIKTIPSDLSHYHKIIRLKEKFILNNFSDFITRIKSDPSIENIILTDEQDLVVRFYLNTEWVDDFEDALKEVYYFAQYLANYKRLSKYLSFKMIPTASLTISELIDEVNLEFLKFESYSQGRFFSYNYYDFDHAMTYLFYFASRPENHLFPFSRYINTYYELLSDIAYDFDKNEFENEGVYDNPEFIKVADEITKLVYDRVEEFALFAKNEEPKKATIKDLLVKTVNTEEKGLDAINQVGKFAVFNEFMKHLQFNYPIKYSPISHYFEWKEDLKFLREEIFDNLITLRIDSKKAYLQKLQFKLEEKTDSVYVLDADYRKLLSDFEILEEDVFTGIDYTTVFHKIIYKDPPDYDNTFEDDYHPSTQRIQYEFYNYHYGKALETATAFILERIDEISPQEKITIPLVSIEPTKSDYFESLSTVKKVYILQLLEDLSITNNGVSIISERKKSALRGITEALLAASILPALSLEKCYRMIADKIGLNLNSKLDYTNTSITFAKKTEQYLKDNPLK